MRASISDGTRLIGTKEFLHSRKFASIVEISWSMGNIVKGGAVGGGGSVPFGKMIGLNAR
jgi:hypothetical protein